MSKPRLSFALFGAGRIGTVHFTNMLTNQRAAIKWIIEEDMDRARQLVEKYKLQDIVQVLHISNAQQALEDKSVDGVLICTPHLSHELLVKQALKAGKPVFCEKPLSVTIDAIKGCYVMAASCGLPLMCAFNRRFDPQNRLIYNKVRKGEIGKVRVVKVTSRDPKDMMNKAYLKISGGCFVDSMVHDINLACFVVGEYPVSVYATGHATNEMYQECGDFDTAVVTLKFPGGAIATLELSRCINIHHDQRLEVLGNEGLLQSENKRPVEVLQWGDEGVHQEPIYHGLDRYTDSYRMEVEHFIDVLQGKCELEISSKATIVTNITAEACKASIQSGSQIDLHKFAQKKFDYSIE